MAALGIVILRGGLGNQMFQYAFGLGLQKAHPDAHILFDHSPNPFARFKPHERYALGTAFGVRRCIFGGCTSAQLLSGAKITTKVQYGDLLYKQQLLLQPIHGIVWYRGYWQSEKWFHSAAQQVRSTFRFREPTSSAAQTALAEMRTCTAVALHIRRTDYQQSALHCDLYADGYYERAIAMIRARVQDPVFFVFSDDIAWCREHFTSEDFRFVDCGTAEPPHTDMFLMTQCQHVVIANSTYSWWGAWLNSHPEKVVIAPAQWFKPNTVAHDTDDLMPAEWCRA
jgi:hypothetical protein